MRKYSLNCLILIYSHPVNIFFVPLIFFSLSREYEKIYFELKHLTFKEIVAKTGCKKPCSYREYREVGKATRIFEYEESHKGLKLWIVGRERVSEVSNIYDFHHYPYGNFAHFQVLIYKATSLLAEAGGTLGLFLGFSFMSLWDATFVVRRGIDWITTRQWKGEKK